MKKPKNVDAHYNGTTPLSVLQRYWQAWETVLKPLVKDKAGARLFFPAQLQQKAPVAPDTFYSLKPTDPIFIFNAPTKASSKRGRGSTRLSIFIDGTFEVFPGGATPCMHKAECNVTFYNTVENDEVTTFSFFDAIHFDFEVADAQTPFHPIFHAQRGKSRTVNDAKVLELAMTHLHLKAEQIKIEGGAEDALGSPYLRLPTPQLDMFSVITLVMADFFCNGGDVGKKDSKVEERFKTILEHLRAPANIIREGFASKALKERFGLENHVSTAHWYAECA